MSKLPKKQLIFLVVIFFVWFCWGPYFLSFFNDHIIQYLYIRTGALTNILFIVLCLYFLLRIIASIQRRYTTSYSHIFLMLSVGVIYFSARCEGDYITLPNWFDFLGYSDILAGLSLLFSLSCFVYRFYKPKQNLNQNEIDFKMIPDVPITSSEDDLLDYHRDAVNLYEVIKRLPVNNSHSIGIVSPWGSGKTSYMNMVKELMGNDQFIIVNFNPRHSKEAKLIQEDFFKKLCSQLKIYNGEFSTLFEDYLDALNIIDKKGFVSWLRLYNKLTGRTDRKKPLQSAISRLNKRIVVFIEDFDRLLDAEIIETFKLIDGNASFSNIIFISAYDKEHLRKLLGAKYDNEEGKFSDKFFSLEEYLPRRPYEIILDFVSQKLKELLSWNESNCESHKAWLRSNRELIQKYIPTMRDAKRFLNLFLKDYFLIKNEVVFNEYFLVSLIKYKYPQELNALYEKKYLTQNIVSSVFEIVKDCDAKSTDIIETLFPTYHNTLMQGTLEDYKSIRFEMSFHKYFENYVYGILSVEQMEKVLDPATDSVEVKRILADWQDKKAIPDLLKYLDLKNLFSHGSRLRFERYVDILFWITSYINLDFHIARLITKIHIDKLLQIYGYEDEATYKQFIESKFRNDEYPYITRQLILDSLNAKQDIEFIFTKGEMLEWSKLYLDNYIATGKSELNVYKNLLYSCIADVDKISQKTTLDTEACNKVRQLIEEYPCSYLDGFVFPNGGPIHLEYIACEPFWEQIFGSANNFEAFINDPTHDNCGKITLVRNFWRLYKRNNYKQIFYEGMGNVQEKIDNALREEISKLDRLEAIERGYEEEKTAFAAAPERESIYRDKLKELNSEIEGLHIPIEYRGFVLVKITQSLNELAQV